MSQGEVIIRLIKYFGKSCAGIEKELGLSNGVLSKYKQGLRKDIPHSLITGLKIRGLNPEYFITGAGKPELDGVSSAQPGNGSTGLIPFLDAQASAGSGTPMLGGEIARYIAIPDSVAHIKGLTALTVHGDSMYPTLADGDIVICDSAGWSGDGIYVIRTADSLFVKRVVLTPAGYQVISDNALYPPYACKTEDAEMIGRVRCAVVRKV